MGRVAKECCKVTERSSVPCAGTLNGRPALVAGIGKCTGVVVKGDEEAELGMTGDSCGVRDSLRIGHTEG
jgi:hypothetical protein